MRCSRSSRRSAADERSHRFRPRPDGALQQLVGLSIARGFTRALNERFGRQFGCAHLTALIQAMAPVVRQAIGPAFRDYEEIPAVCSTSGWRPATSRG